LTLNLHCSLTDEPYNHKSDVWALGILIYELTALELPFLASNQVIRVRGRGRGSVALELPFLAPNQSLTLTLNISRTLTLALTL